ncbi:hypothetical protein CSIM01_13323 [Colletotrichum simmondsii]|uniref:Uncharacterized protein n=1 Tax=Colletotrichum simmondsii TaxID=703756 RepID=A0A135TYI0_9PEZI|nr:hypothetical protein CSIM01_13323 [Colletotrichum simmondsii]
MIAVPYRKRRCKEHREMQPVCAREARPAPLPLIRPRPSPCTTPLHPHHTLTILGDNALREDSGWPGSWKSAAHQFQPPGTPVRIRSLNAAILRICHTLPYTSGDKVHASAPRPSRLVQITDPSARASQSGMSEATDGNAVCVGTIQPIRKLGCAVMACWLVFDFADQQQRAPTAYSSSFPIHQSVSNVDLPIAIGLKSPTASKQILVPVLLPTPASSIKPSGS